MYKVFLNERLISICAKEKIAKKQKSVFFNDTSTTEDIKKWFDSFVNSNLNEITIIHDNPHDFFILFRNTFKFVPAAGGIVYSGEDILFIFRNGKWDLPKGKINSSESPEHAALREVAEECGISGHEIIKPLPSTFHIYNVIHPGVSKRWILKETYWYKMKYDGTDAGMPQKDEGITEIKWIPENDLKEIFANTYENIKLLLRLVTSANENF